MERNSKIIAELAKRNNTNQEQLSKDLFINFATPLIEEGTAACDGQTLATLCQAWKVSRVQKAMSACGISAESRNYELVMKVTL